MANKFLIKNPLITEKAAALSRDGKYVFVVEKQASATEARKAVEEIYNVKVVRTNVVNSAFKNQKKIIMTLAKGQKLDIIPQ